MSSSSKDSIQEGKEGEGASCSQNQKKNQKRKCSQINLSQNNNHKGLVQHQDS
jgi:hypothetical protein